MEKKYENAISLADIEKKEKEVTIFFTDKDDAPKWIAEIKKSIDYCFSIFPFFHFILFNTITGSPVLFGIPLPLACAKSGFGIPLPITKCLEALVLLKGITR